MVDDRYPTESRPDAMARHPDAPDIGNFSRRGFLGAAAGGAAVAAIAARAEAQHAPVPLEQMATVWFTSEEWSVLIALCNRLIPAGGDGPGALESRVPVFIDRQMASFCGQGGWWYMEGPHQPDAGPDRGFQSPLNLAAIFRQGMAHFDQWCRDTQGGAFAVLDAQQRHAAVDALMNVKTALLAELRDFPDFLLTSVKQDYLSGPRHGGNHGMLAWSHVGYPGARGNCLSWTGPARDAMPYPLGLVSNNGERG